LRRSSVPFSSIPISRSLASFWANLLYREGRLDEAASQLELAIRLEPGNEAAIYQLAQVYSKKGDAVRAKPLFAKVSKMKTEERENFASRRLQQIIRADSQTQ
jgi:DNA-binding SARP family transcriptional activator